MYEKIILKPKEKYTPKDHGKEWGLRLSLYPFLGQEAWEKPIEELISKIKIDKDGKKLQDKVYEVFQKYGIPWPTLGDSINGFDDTNKILRILHKEIDEHLLKKLTRKYKVEGKIPGDPISKFFLKNIETLPSEQNVVDPNDEFLKYFLIGARDYEDYLLITFAPIHSNYDSYTTAKRREKIIFAAADEFRQGYPKYFELLWYAKTLNATFEFVGYATSRYDQDKLWLLYDKILERPFLVDELYYKAPQGLVPQGRIHYEMFLMDSKLLDKVIKVYGDELAHISAPKLYFKHKGKIVAGRGFTICPSEEKTKELITSLQFEKIENGIYDPLNYLESFSIKVMNLLKIAGSNVLWLERSKLPDQNIEYYYRVAAVPASLKKILVGFLNKYTVKIGSLDKLRLKYFYNPKHYEVIEVELHDNSFTVTVLKGFSISEVFYVFGYYLRTSEKVSGKLSLSELEAFLEGCTLHAANQHSAEELQRELELMEFNSVGSSFGNSQDFSQGA